MHLYLGTERKRASSTSLDWCFQASFGPEAVQTHWPVTGDCTHTCFPSRGRAWSAKTILCYGVRMASSPLSALLSSKSLVVIVCTRCRFSVSIPMWEKLTVFIGIEFPFPLNGKSNHGPENAIEELSLWCDSLSYRPERYYKVWFWKVKEFIVSWKKWETRSCLKSMIPHSQENRG